MRYHGERRSTPETVCWPASARTHLAAHSALPVPRLPSRIQGRGSRDKERPRREGRERGGERLKVPYQHFSFSTCSRDNDYKLSEGEQLHAFISFNRQDQVHPFLFDFVE